MEVVDLKVKSLRGKAEIDEQQWSQAMKVADAVQRKKECGTMILKKLMTLDANDMQHR
jgi:hypothetical protein